jgi:excisionase family DNA binding protein
MAELLTITKVAEICQVERSTIYRWIKTEKLPATKLPSGVSRVKKDELLIFLEEWNFPIPTELTEEGKPRILVVDDDLIFIKALIVELQKTGNWEIEFAENGYDACVKVGTFKPNVFLFDLQMPEMDGLKVTKSIKGNHHTRKISIMAVTTDKSDITDEMYAAGILEAFVKPFEPVRLARLIREIVEEKKK